MQLPLRKTVFWVHLVCGLAIGGVVLMMSVTGVLLTYQKQMTQWSDRAFWTEPTTERVAPLSDLVAAANAYAPNASVSSLTIHSGEDGPIAASIGGGRTLYLDPSTAEVRGENTTGMRAFFSTTMRIHRWFAVSGEGRSTARAITGWSNLLFLGLIVSGLYLWFPRRWTVQHVRPILLWNRKARGKARDFNWHHVIGFWTAIPLALVVASATVISFPWASDLAYRVMGDEPTQRQVRVQPSPAPTSAALLGSVSPNNSFVPEVEAPPAAFDPITLDALWGSIVDRRDEWRAITIRLPGDVATPIEVRIEEGWGGEPQKRHTVRYDAADGRELSHETFGDQSRGRQFRVFLRFAHTGEYFGVAGQTIAGIVTLLSVLLVWSGFALAWRRLMTPLLRRAT